MADGELWIAVMMTRLYSSSPTVTTTVPEIPCCCAICGTSGVTARRTVAGTSGRAHWTCAPAEVPSHAEMAGTPTATKLVRNQAVIEHLL